MLLRAENDQRSQARGQARVALPRHAVGEVYTWVCHASGRGTRLRCHQPHAAAPKVSVLPCIFPSLPVFFVLIFSAHRFQFLHEQFICRYLAFSMLEKKFVPDVVIT